MQRKDAAGFCGPAFDTPELMASHAPCTGLIPSGRALILSILSILSKKQRKDDGINNERTDPLRSASGYANAPDSTT